MAKEKVEKADKLAERFKGFDLEKQDFILGYMIGVQQEKRNRNKDNANKKDIIKN